MPDPDTTTGRFRQMAKETVEEMLGQNGGGFPWRKVTGILTAVSVALGILVALKTQGWFPVLRVTFDQHQVQDFAPLAADMACEICLRQCATVWCPTCSPAQCYDKCRGTGDCR